MFDLKGYSASKVLLTVFKIAVHIFCTVRDLLVKGLFLMMLFLKSFLVKKSSSTSTFLLTILKKILHCGKCTVYI